MEIKLDKTVLSNRTPEQVSPEQTQKEIQKNLTTPAAQLSDGFGKLQKQVLQLADDSDKVEQARQAILKGELDTKEAILSAAGNLLTFGL